MNKNVMIIAGVVAVVAVVAVAAFFLLSGPKWDDSVDNWVLSQDVHEGDYIEYADTYTVESVNGNTCIVRMNNDSSTFSMSKQDFLRLLSAKEQVNRFFTGSYFSIAMHLDNDDSTGSMKKFEGDIRTDKFGFMDDYDVDMYIGPHNILRSWHMEDAGTFMLRTNLPFVGF